MRPFDCSVATFFLCAVASTTAERLLGAYVFQRHGDRTAKGLPHVSLTDLGYREMFMTGTTFRDRYLSPNSTYHIDGINSNVVDLSQIAASAPDDAVIRSSGQAFLQGLYPPVGPGNAEETLRNGSTVKTPLNGYQLIPMSTVQSGTNSENRKWLEGTSSCKKAKVSSDDYFDSRSYHHLLASTDKLYQSLSTLVSPTIPRDELNYKNAYVIWDLLNVAMIHNSTSTFAPSNSFSDGTMQELRGLASTMELNLAYNSSEPIRAIAGKTLAGEVLSALKETVNSGGSPKLAIQFGSYATFLSYFGIAGLLDVNPSFHGIPSYASSMAWELVTNAKDGMPTESDIKVRFLFHNGTSTPGATDLNAYPLFGQTAIEMPWAQFADNMNHIAISSEGDWCHACGNTTGICASTKDATSNPPGNITRAVAGVIGAMVTLSVIGIVVASIMLLFGLRLVRKSTMDPVSKGIELSE